MSDDHWDAENKRRLNRWVMADHEIAYREYGHLSSEKPSLILIHGYGGSPKDWDFVAKQMAQMEHRHVVVPNLTNIYFSVNHPLSFSAQVQVLSQFLLHIADGKQIDMCAASFGGTLSLAVAVKYPKLYQKLALVAPMPSHPLQRIRNYFLRAFIKAGKAPAILLGFISTNVGKKSLIYLQKIIHLNLIPTKRNHLEAMSTRKIRTLAMIVQHFHKIVELEDWANWEKRYSEITCPVMILWGKQDYLFSREEPARMQRIILHSEFHWIQKAGHLAMKDQPDEVIRHLRSFL